VKEFLSRSASRFPGGSRGPSLGCTNVSSVGKSLQLFDGLMALPAGGWIPAFAGKARSGSCLPQARSRFFDSFAISQCRYKPRSYRSSRMSCGLTCAEPPSVAPFRLVQQ
jgi:hypothetical protein